MYDSLIKRHRFDHRNLNIAHNTFSKQGNGLLRTQMLLYRLYLRDRTPYKSNFRCMYSCYLYMLLHTFILTSSVLDLNFLLLFPPHPVENSAPKEVSAVKECLVPLFDSNINPGTSSFKIVD